MFIVAHVFIALLSVLVSTISYFRPAKTPMIATYVLVGLTLISGTYLVLHSQGRMLQSCITGVVYVVFQIYMIQLTKAKLAKKTLATSPILK